MGSALGDSQPHINPTRRCVEGFGGGLIHPRKKLAINVQGRLDGGVPQSLLDDLDVLARLNQ